MKVFVLDACALIAFLRKEDGYDRVISIFDQATLLQVKVLMHTASLSEVYYDFYRTVDILTAEAVLFDMPKLPVELLALVSAPMIREIGYFKTHYKISFADSFVLATAKLNNGTIVTSDHHEFEVIEKSGDCAFEWIR